MNLQKEKVSSSLTFFVLKIPAFWPWFFIPTCAKEGMFPAVRTTSTVYRGGGPLVANAASNGSPNKNWRKKCKRAG